MATIVDIRELDFNNLPNNEIFAVDTNIFIWMYYQDIIQHAEHFGEENDDDVSYQLCIYPSFIKKLYKSGNKLCTTVINLNEFCSVIERKQFNLYKESTHNWRLKLKSFRDIAEERELYQRRVKQCFRRLHKHYSEIFNIKQTINGTYAFVNRIPFMKCDIADYTVIEYMKSLGITNFISDDKDFTTVDGITLYTTYEDSHYQTQNTDDRSSSTNSSRLDGRNNSTSSGRTGARSSSTNLNRLNSFSGSRPRSSSQSH